MSGDRYSVTFKTAHEVFPLAFVHFDIQCSDLAGLTDLTFRLYRKKGTYSQGKGQVSRDRLSLIANGYRFRDRVGALKLVWHEGAEVWVRASFGVSSQPL